MTIDFVLEKFTLGEAYENRLLQSFANGHQGFYESDHMKLPSKWQ